MQTEDKGWNPYVAGALSGLVLVLSVVIAGQLFGSATSYVRTVGMIEYAIDPDRVEELEYFRRVVPKIDWQWMFVVGIFLGSLVSSLTSNSFKAQAVPDLWKGRFGADPMKRGVVAFLGGIVAMFGARMASGCPSGHGLSGVSQLALSGLLAMTGFFIGGIVVAQLLYRQGGKG